jgi:hypothetical protein
VYVRSTFAGVGLSLSADCRPFFRQHRAAQHSREQHSTESSTDRERARERETQISLTTVGAQTRRIYWHMVLYSYSAGLTAGGWDSSIVE